MNYGFDKKKLKQIKELILFFAVIVLALLCRKEVGNAIVIMISILRPFLYGGVIAFVLNLPLNIIEKKMLKNWNGKNADKMKRPVSVVLSILFVILILVIVVSAVVPQLTKTVVELGNKIPVFAENAGVWLEGFAAEYPQLQGYVAELETLAVDWDSLVAYIVEFLKNGVSDMVLSTVTVAGNIIGAFLNFFIGFVLLSIFYRVKRNWKIKGGVYCQPIFRKSVKQRQKRCFIYYMSIFQILFRDSVLRQ